MTTTELRRRVQSRIGSLSKQHLQVAENFLAYLEERESDEATEELLRIPGFLAGLARAERQIAHGKTVPVGKLRRKY